MGVGMAWAGLLQESLKVVYRRSCLALASVHGGHDAPHVGAVYFLVIIVIVVGHSRNALRVSLTPLLAPLVPFLASWLVVSDGTTLLLPGVAFLLPGTG
jgi:hypothetical protein